MSHELTITGDGRAEFVGAEDAWHCLGSIVGHDFTVDEMATQCPELLFPVVKAVPTYMTEYGVSEGAKVGIVRSDGLVVGEGHGADSYGVVQPAERFGWAAEFAAVMGQHEGTTPRMVSAGTLRGGSQTFVTFAVGGLHADGIDLEGHLSFLGSYDGTLAEQALVSHTNVVCANTMQMALGSAIYSQKFRHTRNVEDRIGAALGALRMVQSREHALETEVARMVSTPLTVRGFDLLLDGVIPLPSDDGPARTRGVNARQAIRTLWEDTVYVGGHKFTHWGAVQAVNTFENWVAPIRRTAGLSLSDARAVRQFDQAVNGQGLTVKAQKVLVSG